MMSCLHVVGGRGVAQCVKKINNSYSETPQNQYSSVTYSNKHVSYVQIIMLLSFTSQVMMKLHSVLAKDDPLHVK